MQSRLQQRLEELAQERQIAPPLPVVIVGALVVPQGLPDRLGGEGQPQAGTRPEAHARETRRVEGLAMDAVMAAERVLCDSPRGVGAEKIGYDVESRVPETGELRFIEVKGRAVGAEMVPVTRNEILTALNKPDGFILAVVEVEGDAARPPRYVRRPSRSSRTSG